MSQSGRFKFEIDKFNTELELTIHSCLSIDRWRVGWPSKEKILCAVMKCDSSQLAQGWFMRVIKRINSENRKLKGEEISII